MQCKLTFRSAGERHIGPRDIDLLDLGTLITASAKFLRRTKREGSLKLDSLTDECIALSADVLGKAAEEVEVTYRELELPPSKWRPVTRKRVTALTNTASSFGLDVTCALDGRKPVSLSNKGLFNSSYETTLNFTAIYCGHKIKDDGTTVLHLNIEGENFESHLRVDDESARRLMLQKLPNDVRSRVQCEGNVLRDWRSLKVLQYTVSSIAPALDSKTALANLIEAMRPWAAAAFIDESMGEERNDEDSV